MPSHEHKHERRAAIARLLRAHAIERQAELVALLRGEGYPATQSSVSRDLKDMGAVKLQEGYRLPNDETDGEALNHIAEFVRDVRSAGPNLIVVTTAVGAAQRVCVTLDRISWPEVVGTISGDDTIFIATSGSQQQRRLRARLRQSLGGASR